MMFTVLEIVLVRNVPLVSFSAHVSLVHEVEIAVWVVCLMSVLVVRRLLVVDKYGFQIFRHGDSKKEIAGTRRRPFYEVRSSHDC